MIHPVLEERLRRPPPPSSPVVSGSTPVACFGDFRRARVATIGMNPSTAEFLDVDGTLYSGDEARLATLPDLGVASLQDAPLSSLEKIFEANRSYFARNPYWRQFAFLEAFLHAVGSSYRDGSACHLSLSPWATAPTWGGLAPPDRQHLLEDGVPFLRWQLTEHHISYVFLNGRTVMSAFSEAMELPLTQVATLTGPEGRGIALYRATPERGPLAVIGWPVSLQPSPGVTSLFRSALAQAVTAELGRSAAA